MVYCGVLIAASYHGEGGELCTSLPLTLIEENFIRPHLATRGTRSA